MNITGNTAVGKNEKYVGLPVVQMPMGSFVAQISRNYRSAITTILLIVVAGGLVAGIFIDLKWLLLAFLILLVAAPACLALLFYSEALRPENFINRLPHTVVIQPEGIRIISLLKERNEENEQELTDSEEDKSNANAIPSDDRPSEPQAPQWKMVGERLIPLEDIDCLTLRPKQAILYPEKTRKGFLYLPEEAFRSEDEYAVAITQIRKRINAGKAEKEK